MSDIPQNGVIDADAEPIVYEFCHLLEKSKHLFNGLRDLPQYGHKQWHAYFGRAFDVYTKLWKYQQQHRELLDASYGLKRWQVGEIASKIGQLYYHYYLRTSETNYLNESFAFYSAIRTRAYYSKANREERPDLMVKKLRYYARFVIVCLLLKKMKLVRDLTRELAKHIDDYTTIYQPEDAMEWSLVLQEIKAFLDADAAVTVLDSDSMPASVPQRLDDGNCPPLEAGVAGGLQLAEVLIVGNCQEQVKFSELTLDMFRMLQTLERAPQPELAAKQPPDASPLGRPLGRSDRLGRRDNPHKYLLYKPTCAQLIVFLASSFRELPADSALLLYVSADGDAGQAARGEGDRGYDDGGVVTNSRRDAEQMAKCRRPNGVKNTHCIYPGDIFPFTRKPLFLIVDSGNSGAFGNIPNLFGQPLVCLLSPEQLPPGAIDQRQQGSLFTLFLHSPLAAFCCVCSVPTVSVAEWQRAQAVVDEFLREAGRLLVRSRQLDAAYAQFYGDDFLRLVLLRYLFCSVALRLHSGFRGPRYYPACRPPLPEQQLCDSPLLRKLLLDLATMLDAQTLFAGEFSA